MPSSKPSTKPRLSRTKPSLHPSAAPSYHKQTYGLRSTEYPKIASFNKFQHFITDCAAGVHVNCLNADTDVLKVYLSDAAPNAASHQVKADIAEITPATGYAAGGADAQNAATTATGTITVAGTDITWTAGASIGPFRYAILYNDTPSSPADPLIGWWDYGSEVTLASGETFTVDFGASIFTLA